MSSKAARDVITRAICGEEGERGSESIEANKRGQP